MPKFGTKNAVYGYFWARISKNYCHNCYQHLQIYLIAKFCKKRPKFWSKNAWLGYFWSGISKLCCHIWNLQPQIWLFPKFHVKTKIPKFQTKNAWFGYIWSGTCIQYCHVWNRHRQQKRLNLGPKKPYLGMFGLELGNNFAIFETFTITFDYLQNFTLK